MGFFIKMLHKKISLAKRISKFLTGLLFINQWKKTGKKLDKKKQIQYNNILYQNVLKRSVLIEAIISQGEMDFNSFFTVLQKNLSEFRRNASDFVIIREWSGSTYGKYTASATRQKR